MPEQPQGFSFIVSEQIICSFMSLNLKFKGGSGLGDRLQQFPNQTPILHFLVL